MWLIHHRSTAATIGFTALLCGTGIWLISGNAVWAIILDVMALVFIAPLVFAGAQRVEVETRVEIVDLIEAMKQFPGLWFDLCEIENILRKPISLEVYRKTLAIVCEGNVVGYVTVKKGVYIITEAKVPAIGRLNGHSKNGHESDTTQIAISYLDQYRQ